MRRRGTYRMMKADDVAVLELPYAGGAAAMLVVLPSRADGLESLERSLDAARLAAWTRALAAQEVLVWLPRFVIDPAEPLLLTRPLQALGMAQSFDPLRADFTAIASPPRPADRLHLGGVFHKAFVKVDEQGTEAAAATAVAAPTGGAPPPPAAEFKADHPFLFFIVDSSSGLVLFMGRVSDPKAP